MTTVALYFTFLQTENNDPITSQKIQTEDLLILYQCKLLTLQIPCLCLLFLYHTAQTGPLFSHWKTKPNQTTKCNELKITISYLKFNHLNKKPLNSIFSHAQAIVLASVQCNFRQHLGKCRSSFPLESNCNKEQLILGVTKLSLLFLFLLIQSNNKVLLGSLDNT